MAVADKPTAQNGKAPQPDTIPVKNPVTGEIIGEIEKTSREQIETAVRRARVVQRIWRAVSVSERCKMLRKFGDLIWEHQRDIMVTLRAETGKTDTGAFIEMTLLDNYVMWCMHHAPRTLAPERRTPGFPLLQYAKVYHKPYGVVGFITPWNYPLVLGFVDAIPALIAGNAVIIKPSEITPYTTLYVRDLLHRAGFHEDLVQVVTGDGSTGAALVDYVDYISFTGSTEIGKQVGMKAAERLIPCTLELGGNDSMLVLRDANLDLAAAGAIAGGLENAGQLCLSTERVYVEAAVYDEFVEKVKHYASQLIVGPGDGYNVHVGSMTNERELERVERYVADAIAKGAKLIYGGKRRPDLGPLFYEPAILVDVDHSMEVMTEETFGPIVPIMRVQNEAEGVALTNSTRYGLSGLIYTRNLKLGEHLATQFDTGDVSVNRVGAVVSSAALPWGGRKESGLGRRGGREGLLRFTSTQSIAVDTQIGAKPALTPVDPLLLVVLRVLRVLRRYVSFI